MNQLLSAALAALACTVLGCAATPQAPAQSPASAPAPARADDQSSAAKRQAPAPAKVPDPPSSCKEYVERSTAQCEKSDARELLAAAVSDSNAATRDQKLACLENEKLFPPGLMRTLRADLAPEVCGDALATPLLESNTKLGSEIEDALLGFILAGKLARLASDPPTLAPPFDKPQFLKFFADELKPWVLAQAAAIGELSVQGARLNGYGKAVAAVSAGLADLRFVDMVREIPLPDEMKKDSEVRDVYYGALDEALEPRKNRGRDAALVGLRLFAQLGAIRDERIDRARALLSKLYSGARVDALDRLIVPKLGPAKLDTTPRKLAAGLPSYYTLVLLGDLDVTDPSTLRALLERGLTAPLRKRLDESKLTPELTKLYARGVFELGRRYFRAADFRLAGELVGPKPADDDQRLLSALSKALQAGPADVAELMLKGPPPSGLGDLSELEAMAKGRGRHAAAAAFDAAFVLELVPRHDDASFWQDVAARYDAAAKGLTDAAEKKRAGEYAAAARATAQALGGKP